MPPHSETRAPIDTAVMRLRHNGATQVEIDAFVAGWDLFDEDAGWTPESRADWLRQSDAVIRAEIGAARREHYEHTHTEDEEAADVADAELGELLRLAREVVPGSVGSVLTWVAGDRNKAIAVLEVEEGDDGAKRSTLIAPLRAIFG